MRNGKIGLGFYDDLFGISDIFVNYGGYADPMMSLAVPSVGIAPNSPPVAEKGFGYFFPVLEVRHHYDVNYFDSDYWQNGQVSGGNYSYSNYSIDLIDQYSWFGHTSAYHVVSNSGYGSWTSAPGYYSSWGHNSQSEYAGVHSDTWFGSSDTFVFRNTDSDYSHLELGNLVISNSHTVVHEGAGVHVNSILESVDGFVFRDTVIDSAHVQIGDLSFDAFHSDVRSSSQMTYSDIFGGYGHGQTASVEVHDQWSQSQGNRYESHTSDYASHTTDTMTIGIPAYMVAGLQMDDMSLLLGMGGGKG